jgi:hypothetical protein
MRSTSILALGLIFACIGAAVLLILQLGEGAETSRGADFVHMFDIANDLATEVDKYRAAVAEGDTAIIESERELEELRKQLADEADGASRGQAKKVVTIIDGEPKETSQFELDRERVTFLSVNHAKLKSFRERDETALEKAISAQRDNDVSIQQALAGNRTRDIATVLLRLSVGVIFVFLVQILTTVYRYTIRMSAFYQGRADALMVYRENARRADVPMKELIDWFAGDKVSFDKAPKAPAEMIGELVTTVTESAVRGTKRGEKET